MPSLVLVVVFALSRPIVLGDDTVESKQRKLSLPVIVGANVKSMRLWVSGDQGKTWQQHAVLPSTAKAFEFAAPNDGHFWFSAQTVSENGVVSSRRPVAGTRPSLKVYVNTIGRPCIWGTPK
jgi:hypothetical protein